MNNVSTKAWLEAQLEAFNAVVIYVNPRVAGVSVPEELNRKESFTLLLSHHFDRPIIFKETELKSDFQFDNGFQTCLIPWNSIWAAHPENLASQICFWNDNSPGLGWDKALSQYLGVISEEAVFSGVTDRGPTILNEKSVVVRELKIQPKKVKQPLAKAKKKVQSEASELPVEQKNEKNEQMAEINNLVPLKPALSRSHLKLIK